MEEAVAFYLSEAAGRDGEVALGMGTGTKPRADFAFPKQEDGIRYGFYGKYYDDFYLS